MLTSEEHARYERNLLIPGFGEEAQQRLANARVCVVGLGGLGSPAALYLAAAGVGTLGLIDSDRVDLSNLQRQVIHNTNDIGRLKVESAAEKIAALNPGVTVQCVPQRLTLDNAQGICAAYDVVVEATDNFEAKYLINDICLLLKKPFATAGILSLSGQGLFAVPGKTACLRCAVHEPPRNVPTTAQLGVLGAVPGMLGSLEVLETLRYLVGQWTPREDGAALLHTVEGHGVRLRTMPLPRRSDCRCAVLWA